MAKGVVVWLTGIPCSGKTAIAKCMKRMLGDRVFHLDGDETRKSISKDLGFSDEERLTHLSRISKIAKLAMDQGYIVVCSFVSPSRAVRDMLRAHIGPAFVEVHVSAPPYLCAQRDVKGMWALAHSGKIKGFTGFDARYEMPQFPEVTVDTENETLMESTAKILTFLYGEGYV